MKNNSSRNKIYEKNSRIHMDRLQNIHGDCKRTKYNCSFGQNTRIKKKLVATHKQNAP